MLKIFGNGASFDSTFNGLDFIMNRKQAAMKMPCNVACESLNLKPSTYSTDKQYADINAFNANILNICNVVTSVHRPCLMILHTVEYKQIHRDEKNRKKRLYRPATRRCASNKVRAYKIR